MLLSDREFSLLNKINHLLSLVLKLPQEHSYRVYTHPSTISITVRNGVEIYLKELNGVERQLTNANIKLISHQQIHYF